VRRALALPGLLLLLLPGLVACGDNGGDQASGQVSVTGEAGSPPEVTYDGRLEPDSTETEVLHEGDGPALQEGDSAFLHLYIGNGYTGEQAYSTWDDERPSVVQVSDQTLPALRDAIAGQAIGSRVQVVATPEDAYGETGNPDIGIGDGDAVVFVIDLLSTVLDAPEGNEPDVPDGLPQVVEDEGTVTGLDFSDAAEPGKQLRVVSLLEGEGPAIEKGSWLAMRYLGVVHGKKKPFDENYTAEAITPFQIGEGGLIKAWDEGLVGVKQGSRVLLVVPPSQGYGKAGNEGAGIKGTDTIVFVVDVLGVA